MEQMVAAGQLASLGTEFVQANDTTSVLLFLLGGGGAIAIIALYFRVRALKPCRAATAVGRGEDRHTGVAVVEEALAVPRFARRSVHSAHEATEMNDGRERVDGEPPAGGPPRRPGCTGSRHGTGSTRRVSRAISAAIGWFVVRVDLVFLVSHSLSASLIS